MNDWQTKKLWTLCELFTDGNWIESKDQSPEGIRLIQTGNIGKGLFKDRGEKARYISETTLKKLKCIEINKGDILISRLPDPVGRACILPETGERMITAVDCSIVRLKKKEIWPEFFNYYSQSNNYLNDIEQRTSGTTRKRISRKNLGAIEIPLPPLPEQKRLVTLLDDLFEKLEKAKENTETNLTNAKEIFVSYLEEYFYKIYNKSQKVRLADVANVTGGYSFKSKDFGGNGKYQVIRMGNVRPGKIRKNEKPVFLDEIDDSISNRALLQKGDVIITQTGTKKKRDYGYTAIIDADGYLLNQRIAGIRFKENYLNSLFLYFSWTNLFKDQFFANETGAVGQGNVGIKAITEAMIPMLDLVEQEKCVLELDQFNKDLKGLKKNYELKSSLLEELKQSILHQAFSGKL